MAQITIENLSTNGSEFFSDSESYLDQLTDIELNVSGGLIMITLTETGTTAFTPEMTLFPTPIIILL